MFGQKLLLCLLVVLTAAVSVEANPVGFKIEDFIPERFVDTRWVVGGDLDFRSSNWFNTNKGMDTDNLDQDVTTGKLYFNQSHSYDYETIPTFFHSHVSTSLNYNHNSSSEDRNEIRFDSTMIDLREYESSSNILSFNINPSMDYGHYLFDDYFMKLSASTRFSYGTNIGNDFENSYFRSDLFGDTYNLNSSNTAGERGNANRSYDGIFLLTNGWGRLYEGQYAASALYIINELKKKELLLKNPTADEMLVLSEMFYNFRNMHAVDIRLHRIEYFDKLFSYLYEQGLIEKSDHYGSLLLMDVYDYFPRQRRMFGMQFEIGVGLNYRYSSRHTSEHSTTHNLETTYEAGTPNIIDTLLDNSFLQDKFSYQNNERLSKIVVVSFVYHKPIDLKWQIDAGTSWQYYFGTYYKYKIINSFDNDGVYNYMESQTTEWKDERYFLSAYCNLTYLLSSRTIISFNNFVSYNRELHTSDYFQVDMVGSMSYRVTIPTTVNVELRFDYDDHESLSNYGKTNRYSLGVSVDHQIL